MTVGSRLAGVWLTRGNSKSSVTRERAWSGRLVARKPSRAEPRADPATVEIVVDFSTAINRYSLCLSKFPRRKKLLLLIKVHVESLGQVSIIIESEIIILIVICDKCPPEHHEPVH